MFQEGLSCPEDVWANAQVLAEETGESASEIYNRTVASHFDTAMRHEFGGSVWQAGQRP